MTTTEATRNKDRQMARWVDALMKIKCEMEDAHTFDEHSYPPDYVALVHIAWQRVHAARMAAAGSILR